MTLLSRQAILAAEDLKTEDVPVPEWGGTVRVRTISAKERDAFEDSLSVGEGKARKTNIVNLRAKLVGLCCIDEGGARVFTDADLEALGAKSASVVDRIFSVAQRLNGLTKEDVEALEKNSGAGLSASSPST
jgi:hypothetical protein